MVRQKPKKLVDTYKNMKKTQMQVNVLPVPKNQTLKGFWSLNASFLTPISILIVNLH